MKYVAALLSLVVPAQAAALEMTFMRDTMCHPGLFHPLEPDVLLATDAVVYANGVGCLSVGEWFRDGDTWRVDLADCAAENEPFDGFRLYAWPNADGSWTLQWPAVTETVWPCGDH
jgi:hypothetical protein